MADEKSKLNSMNEAENVVNEWILRLEEAKKRKAEAAAAGTTTAGTETEAGQTPRVRTWPDGITGNERRELEDQASVIPLGAEADFFIYSIKQRYGDETTELVTEIINNRREFAEQDTEDPLVVINAELSAERAQEDPDRERIELLEARRVAEVNKQDDIRFSRVGRSRDQVDLFGTDAPTYEAPTLQITKPIIAKDELLDAIDPNGDFQLANLDPETNEVATSLNAQIHSDLYSMDKRFSKTGFIQAGMFIDSRDLGRLINKKGTPARQRMVENSRVRGEEIAAPIEGDMFGIGAQTYEKTVEEIEKAEASAREDNRTADEIALATRKVENKADLAARRNLIDRLARGMTLEQRAEITKLARKYSEGYRDGGAEGEGGTYRALREILGTEYSLDILAANIHIALSTGGGHPGGLGFFNTIDEPTSEAERRDIFESIKKIKRGPLKNKAKTKAIAKAKKLLSFGFLPEHFGPDGKKEADSLFRYPGGAIGLDVFTKLRDRSIRSNKVRTRIRDLDANLDAVQEELATERESGEPNLRVMEGLEKKRDTLDREIEEQVRDLDTDAAVEFDYLRKKVEELEKIAVDAQDEFGRVTQGPLSVSDRSGRAVKRSVDDIPQMDRASLIGFLTGDISAGDRAVAEQALAALDSDIGQRITELNQEIEVIEGELTQERATTNNPKVIAEKEKDRTRLEKERGDLTGATFASEQSALEDITGDISDVTYSAESQQIREGAAERHNLLLIKQYVYNAHRIKLLFAPNEVNRKGAERAEKDRNEAEKEFRDYARKHSSETKEQIKLNEQELETLAKNDELVRGLTEEEKTVITNRIEAPSNFAAKSLEEAGVKPATPIYNQAQKFLLQAGQSSFLFERVWDVSQSGPISVEEGFARITKYIAEAQAKAAETGGKLAQVLVSDLRRETQIRMEELKAAITLQKDSLKMDRNIDVEQAEFKLTQYEDALSADKDSLQSKLSADESITRTIKRALTRKVPTDAARVVYDELARLRKLPIQEKIDLTDVERQIDSIKRIQYDSTPGRIAPEENRYIQQELEQLNREFVQLNAKLDSSPTLSESERVKVENRLTEITNLIKEANIFIPPRETPGIDAGAQKDPVLGPEESLRLKIITEPTTVARTQEVLTARFESGILDHITIALSPQAAGLSNIPADVAGSVIRGKIYLFTNNIQRGHELGVLLHELGAHVGMRDFVGQGNYEFLIKKVKQFAALNDGSPEAQIAKTALERVKGAVEASKTEPDEIGLSEAAINDEILAYFVEEAVNRGINPVQESKFKTRLGSWFRRLIAGAKAALGKLGIKFRKIPETVLSDAEIITAQEIVDLAYGAANFAIRTPQSKLTPLESAMSNSLASLAPELEEKIFGNIDEITNNSAPWTQKFAEIFLRHYRVEKYS